MSVLVAMYVTLFNCYCSVCLSELRLKALFLLLQHRKIAKEVKQTFFKLNDGQKKFSIACAEQQRSTA